MSFYGSIYYQATNAIAKIMIKNSGADIKTEATDLEDVEIDADGRAGVLVLDSGNRWIQLKGDDEANTCQIYHNKADKNANNFMRMINIGEDGSDTVIDVAKGVTFTVPLIHYDDAGHLVNNGLYTTYTMPKIEIQSSVDGLTLRVEKLEEDYAEYKEKVDGLQGKIDAANDTVASVNERLGILDAEMAQLHDTLETTTKELTEEQDKLNSALVRDSADIGELKIAVKEIQDWIAAQQG